MHIYLLAVIGRSHCHLVCPLGLTLRKERRPLWGMERPQDRAKTCSLLPPNLRLQLNTKENQDITTITQSECLTYFTVTGIPIKDQTSYVLKLHCYSLYNRNYFLICRNFLINTKTCKYVTFKIHEDRILKLN